MKKAALAAALALAALVWGFWLVAVPGDLVVDFIEDSARAEGMEVRVEGFRKGLFYSFSADAVSLLRSDAALVRATGVSGRLDFAGLLGLRAVVPFRGTVAGGALKGRASVAGGGGYEVDASLEGARVAGIGAVSLAGIKGDGELSGDFHMRDGLGELRFTVKAAAFDAMAYGGYAVPLNMFHTLRGALLIKGDTVEVDSVALEGEGIYARARGKVVGRAVDMELELMPEESVVPESVMMAMAGRYRVSKGYYVIPLKANLDF
ncbi:MAG: hypothetical protein Kow0025_13150 [Thermodesulfovibrionales bacterium]